PSAPPAPRSAPRWSRSAQRCRARRRWESVLASRDRAGPAADAALAVRDGRDAPPLGADAATPTGAGGARARRPRAPPAAAAGAAPRARSAASALPGWQMPPPKRARRFLTRLVFPCASERGALHRRSGGGRERAQTRDFKIGM